MFLNKAFFKVCAQYALIGLSIGAGFATGTALVVRADAALCEHKKNETPTPKDNS